MSHSPALKGNSLERNPLLFAAIAFSAGILIRSEIDYSMPVLLAVVAVLGMAAYFVSNLRTFWVLCIFLFCGSFSMSADLASGSGTSVRELYNNRWIKSGAPVLLTGVLKDAPRTSIDGFVLHLSVDAIRHKSETIDSSGSVQLFVPLLSAESKEKCDSLELHAGNKIEVNLRLRREEKFRNPGTANFLDAMDRHGLDASSTLKSCFLIRKLDDRRSMLSPVFQLREYFSKRVLAIHGPDTAGIIIASLTGNRGFLSRSAGERFRTSGTFHVLVISGLHITFIGAVVLFGVRLVSRNRPLQLIVSASVLWSYAFMVGLELPVVRAVIVFSIGLGSYALYRPFITLNGLGAAVLVILALRPGDLFGPSFQLTFLSVFGIVGFGLPTLERLRSIGKWMPKNSKPFPPDVSRPLRIFCEVFYWSDLEWKDYLSRQVWSCRIPKSDLAGLISDRYLQRVLKSMFEMVFISFCVQAFLLPLLVYYFHRIGPVSLISNLFVGMLVAYQGVTAIIGVLIAELDLEAGMAFVASATVPANLGYQLQDWMSDLHIASFRIPVYSGWAATVYTFYFIPLLTFVITLARIDPFSKTLRERCYRLISIGSLITVFVLGLVIVFHPFSVSPTAGRLTMHFLDVGQGDSTFIVFPNGSTMLVDGGGMRNQSNGTTIEPDRSRIGERVVSEFLWEKGYSKIDYLVSTHPDSDHINGLIDVVKNFRVGVIYANGFFESNEEFVRLRRAAKRKGIPLRRLSKGFFARIGKAKFWVLHPEQYSPIPANDDSLVVRISYGGKSFLLTGDIEGSAEPFLRETQIKSTVVKVPHHGSRTSSTPQFVEAVNAKVAVIPVGRNSPYGHPHVEVVERWRDAGSIVALTGESGTVTISTDGSDLNIERFVRGP
ncbi:MAG: ComEC/Rec2 family competence protein [Pyrinomonadaceae bacterium]|nr:ComEC/Rec2 family competence protein [Pyrinomonadaceae bacterium]